MKWRGLAMRLKTSWFKGELFKQNFRQVGWISLIYFILLFFAVPLNIFMTFNQKRDYFIHYTNVFDFGISIQILTRSEEHTSELQSRGHLVCRLLLEKKKKIKLIILT